MSCRNYGTYLREMSFVGPRPCLLNQHEVIEERQKLGVFDARPGLTGLAQINHIDMSNPKNSHQWIKK